MTSPELTIIITTTATAIVGIVNSIAAGWGRKEVRQRAEEVKQVTQTAHEDLINRVTENKEITKQVADENIMILATKIDRLADRVGHIENQMNIINRDNTERTRSTDVQKGNGKEL